MKRATLIAIALLILVVPSRIRVQPIVEHTPECFPAPTEPTCPGSIPQ
ncbi:MAG: hypothetical protein ABL967_15250 [Bryobacteraceae bacterium]